MSINLDLSATHHVVAASNHTYLEPTQEVSIDRTLAHHDIIYLVEGEWLFTEEVDGKKVEYLLKPDDFLILSAGSHQFTKMPCAPGTKTYCIHITKEKDDLSNNKNNLTIDTHFNCSTNPKVVSCFKSVCDAFWSNEPYNQSVADAYVTLLFCEIAKMQNGKILSTEIQNVIKLINDHSHKTHTKEELINAAGISYKKLSTRFKKETGETLHAYQINKKLEMVALQIETEPDVRLKELAATYDFYDEFHLSKLFKKKYGVSPITYKKNLKGKHRYDTIC